MGNSDSPPMAMDGVNMSLIENVSALGPIVETATCELLGEFGGFGWWIQGALCLLSFSTLFVKRWKEKNRRSWDVFTMDTSKQLLGSLTVHLLNLLSASIISTSRAEDPCNWYWINIVVDCTLGVLVTYLLLQQAKKIFGLEGRQEFGYYGNPPHFNAWMKQSIIWQFVVISMKLQMVGLMIIFHQPLIWLSKMCLACSDHNIKLKLVLVMCVTPVSFNMIQFWLTDSIIKGNSAREIEHTGAKKEYVTVDVEPSDFELN